MVVIYVWMPPSMNDGSLLMLGLEGPQITSHEAELFRRIQPAGYILFTRNIVSPEQTRALTDGLRDLSCNPPIIAIDQEGGRVTRTKDIATPTPSAATLGATANYEAITQAASLTGTLLSLLGFNLNLGPVLDLDHHPELKNALNDRCWGRDPQRVIDYAGHWNRWLRKRKIATCGKHFPACGRATNDPHHDLPSCSVDLETLLKEDIIPYTALMPELDAIMIAHVEFPRIDNQFPASLSPKIIQKLLRDQLGFDRHLVLTDDLDMGAIRNRYGRGQDAKLAIQAGGDLAMICHDTQTAETAHRAIQELPSWILDDAWARIDFFRRKKMHEPLAWSDRLWQSTTQGLQTLAAPFDQVAIDASDSPVNQY